MISSAQRIADAIRSGASIALADATQPESLEEAEAIQDEVVRLLGWRPAAWKLGASNLASREGLGFSRSFSAGLPAERLLRSPARLRLDQARQPGVECELCAGFSESPGSSDDILKLENEALARRVREAVGAFHAAIEIPGSRYPDLGAAGPFALVADNGAADFVVVGPAGDADFERVLWRAELIVDGELAARGDTSVFCDTPLALLADHVRRMARRGQAIVAGAVVVLGSVTPRWPVKAPCQVTVRFEGLSPVELAFG